VQCIAVYRFVYSFTYDCLLRIVNPVLYDPVYNFSLLFAGTIYGVTLLTNHFDVYDSLPMPLHDGLMVVVLDINRLLEGLCYAGSGLKQSAPPPTLKMIKVSVHAILISFCIPHHI
jgi:hypothetical protein